MNTPNNLHLLNRITSPEDLQIGVQYLYAIADRDELVEHNNIIEDVPDDLLCKSKITYLGAHPSQDNPNKPNYYFRLDEKSVGSACSYEHSSNYMGHVDIGTELHLNYDRLFKYPQNYTNRLYASPQLTYERKTALSTILPKIANKQLTAYTMDFLPKGGLNKRKRTYKKKHNANNRKKNKKKRNTKKRRYI